MWNSIRYYSRRERIGYEQLLALARLSLATVTRNNELFQQAIDACNELDIPPSYVFEALLQTYLFAGYPTCLWGFEQFSKHSLFERTSSEEFERLKDEGFDSIRYWHEQGKELFSVIYGNVSDKLYKRVESLHPDLARWMVTEGYGKVLMRDGLPQWVREVCIFVMLGALQHKQQAYSHLRGSLRLGVPYTLLKRILQGVHEWIEPDMYTFMRKSLDNLRTTFRDDTTSRGFTE